jgi:hypothetical protein
MWAEPDIPSNPRPSAPSRSNPGGVWFDIDAAATPLMCSQWYVNARHFVQSAATGSCLSSRPPGSSGGTIAVTEPSARQLRALQNRLRRSQGVERDVGPASRCTRRSDRGPIDHPDHRPILAVLLDFVRESGPPVGATTNATRIPDPSATITTPMTVADTRPFSSARNPRLARQMREASGTLSKRDI